MGWSQLLNKEIIKLPKLGIIGSHPTELPKYRGRAPIPWTILKGLKKSALTFFFIPAQHPRPKRQYQNKGIPAKIDDTWMQQHSYHQDQKQEAVVTEVFFQPLVLLLTMVDLVLFFFLSLLPSPVVLQPFVMQNLLHASLLRVVRIPIPM